MRQFRRVLLLMLGNVLSLAAQTPDTATILGHVHDPSNAVLAGVEIRLTNTRTGFEHTGQTDASGDFRFAGLPVGSYSVLAHKERFADARRDLTVTGGATVEVQLQLNVAGVETNIVVTGALGDVRTDVPQLGDHLSEAVENTPLLNTASPICRC